MYGFMLLPPRSAASGENRARNGGFPRSAEHATSAISTRPRGRVTLTPRSLRGGAALTHHPLTADVRRAARSAVLCWLATVDEAGQPNVSPKEVFAVADGEHLVIANIASPGSAAFLAAEPRVCVSFVDVFVQKGFVRVSSTREVPQ